MTRSTITLITCLVLAACGTARDDATTPDVPEGRAGVILDIRDEGGFAPVQVSLTRIPRFVVFADGSVVRNVPGADGFSLFETTLTEADFTDVLTYLDDLGLADVDRVDVNEVRNVADAPTTVLTMYDANGPHTLGVYALGFDDPADPRSAILSSMIDQLDTATAAQGEPYDPSRYRVLVTADVVEGDLPAHSEWPLSAAPDDIAELGVGAWRCLVIESSDIDPALTERRHGAPQSVWTYQGAPYLVLVGPLFPHEGGC